jgi:hypothetical protein
MALNRASQNWPEDATIIMVADTTPYTHELASDGSGCSFDCPACMYIELNFLDSEIRSQYSEPVDEQERRTR